MKKTLLFDFDGVIVDSFETCYGVSNQFNPGRDLSRDEYRQFFLGNVYEAAASHDKQESSVPVDDPWFQEYVKRLLPLNPISGIQGVLEKLAMEYDLSIISSSLSHCVESYLTKYELENYFESILGADVHKSKVVKMERVLEQKRLTGNDALFITDTLGDIREARKVGVSSIAVTWGFHDVDLLQVGEPKFVVSDPSMIHTSVITHFS